MPPKGERKRRYEPKVRTGCTTCKIRRVKCDEDKPNCKRCTSTGRKCDGYDQIRVAQASTSADGSVSLTWTRPLSQSPDTPVPELVALDVYRLRLTSSLPGVWGSTAWSDTVLAAAASEPALHHIVIALGATEQTRLLVSSEYDIVALRNYSKALKLLQEQIQSQGKLAPDVVLMACLLFFAFEIQRSGWHQAYVHLKGGMSLITEMRQSQQPTLPPKSESSFISLVDAFKVMDVQMSYFTSDRVKLSYGHCAWDAKQGPYFSFDSIIKAWGPLHEIVAGARDLVFTIEAKTFTSGLSSDDHTTLRKQQVAGLEAISHWQQGMDTIVSPQCATRWQHRGIELVLRVHAMVAKLVLSMALADGCELLWDAHIEDFARIVELAKESLGRILDCSEGRQHRKQHFSLHLGIIAPLYFVAVKCRDPTIRHQAVDLLGQCHHQEGVWHGPTHAAAAAKIVALEERGLTLATADDVPESSRLYQAFFDLRNGMEIIQCKRRLFETDRRWIDREERVS